MWRWRRQLLGALFALALCLKTEPRQAETVALWLFDEPVDCYPSAILNDAGPGGHVLALGRGGSIVPGRFGNALASRHAPLPTFEMRGAMVPRSGAEAWLIGRFSKAPVEFGLVPLPRPPGRRIDPLCWDNATFSALATVGEKHLRSPGFANPTASRLNLGNFDWTVEFWMRTDSNEGGVIFEIGEGPRGENERVTRLALDPGAAGFTFFSQPSGEPVFLAAGQPMVSPDWHHVALVHDADARQLSLYADGRLAAPPRPFPARALAAGGESYLSVGRDGLWNRPFHGALDELRFSDHQVYDSEFALPESFSNRHSRAMTSLRAGPPLLFDPGPGGPIELGSRTHLLLDDALVAEAKNVTFVPNPPKRLEKVLDEIRGHLSVVEDETGELRLYGQGPEDSLAVFTSRDGVHWDRPDLGRGAFHGQRNIVLRRRVGLGIVFLDPNAPASERWKYVSGIRRQGIFVFHSADGLAFEPNETAALPFAAGSQSIVYYDDQRQLYAGHHRSDYGATATGSTRRRFVLSETKDLLRPWPYTPATRENTARLASGWPVKANVLDPWYLDNGPLSPSGIGVELPTVFASDDQIDPTGTDIYVTKAQKYPWAPDAYLAFPSVYFHYEGAEPAARRVLGAKERGRGSGVTEVQLAVSRDGRKWRRYPRPAYAPIGELGRDDVHELFLTHGMIRRGDEIWQFLGGHGGNGVGYHSAWKKGAPSPLWRLVQRVDGFVAAEAAYTGGSLLTKQLRFQGSRLLLNVDTGATGFVQVGILDEAGAPIPGYSADESIYANGDFLASPVEWLGKGSNVAPLAGRSVRLYFRMRGARLFAFRFE